MSLHRFSGGATGRTMTAQSPSSQQGRSPTLRLPPLIRDHASATAPCRRASRSMHQLQLELEYDAEESDNDGSEGPLIHGWTGGLERHTTTLSGNNEDQSMTEVHALCVFDDVATARSACPPTRCIEILSAARPVRKWGRWRWREPPSFADARSVESMMLYERGVEKQPYERCKRCRAGHGISPQCVVASTELHGWYKPSSAGPCSNCHYDGAAQTCGFSGDITPVSEGSRQKSPSSPDPGRVVDHMAVLEMIAQLKRPAGATRDHSLPARARRIEAAALEIARAAREWGEKISKDA